MSANVADLKKKVCAEVDRLAPELYDIARRMYENPELGHQERASSAMLVEMVEKHGLKTKLKVAGMETSFVATAEGGQGAGAHVGILAEYDALPDIGHGCGHNIIGTASTGAALALKAVLPELPGKVTLFGAPAEEGVVDNAGGKVLMTNAGLFNDVDAAMCVHPSAQTMLGTSSTARYAFEVSFKGKPAHAAGSPHEGINALDALLLMYSGINSLRQHVKEDVRIHGIITKGGVAPNIVPEFTQGRFYVRANDRNYLKDVIAKVENCARAGALATGATVSFRQTALTYENMLNNDVLGEAYKANLESLGVKVHPAPAKSGGGSTDMGNVSHVCPAIHPYISICGPGIAGHSREFADATMTEAGRAGMVAAAKAMAMTAIDVLTDTGLRGAAKKEFEARK